MPILCIQIICKILTEHLTGTNLYKDPYVHNKKNDVVILFVLIVVFCSFKEAK